MRLTILIIVSLDRFENYEYLSALEEHELICLWYTKPEELPQLLQSVPIKFSKIIYWNQFRTPVQLLKNVRPDRIIFFEIIDLRQISLIVSAKAKGISTFYLEHGAAGSKETAISRWDEISIIKHKVPYLAKRLANIWDVVKSKWFYYSVTNGFDSIGSFIKYVKLPLLMLKRGPNETLARCQFKERVPKRSIVFNYVNFEQFQVYTGISKEDAVFTGIPFFDKYFQAKYEEEDHLVFIDHPYLENKILGWTESHHKKIAATILQFAEEQKIKIFVKLHPTSNINHWYNHIPKSKFVEIVQHGDFTDFYLRSKLILGFSSSLLNGFLCARKNVVLLGWHPEPQIFGVDYAATGLCHKSFLPEDLKLKYPEWINNNLAIKNDQAYSEYLKKFNYPFDGHATERVIKTIVEG